MDSELYTKARISKLYISRSIRSLSAHLQMSCHFSHPVIKSERNETLPYVQISLWECQWSVFSSYISAACNCISLSPLSFLISSLSVFFLTFWHTNHSATLDHLWSGPTGPDSERNKIFCASSPATLPSFSYPDKKEECSLFQKCQNVWKAIPNEWQSNGWGQRGPSVKCWTELSQSSS